VPGLSNLAVSGQASNTLKETLFNTTNAPVSAVYTVESQTPVCQSAPFDVVIVVNPTVNITSASSGMACSGEPQPYAIKSNVPVATFVWSRPAVNGIRNTAVSNKTTDTIKEALINTSPSQIKVTVNPVLTAPLIRSNSPVCINSTIQLNTTTINGAIYSWTGPNGFTSKLQNPTVKNVTMADSGIYQLTITVNGCTSPTASIDVKINQLPHANAGPDQKVCRETAGVKLSGAITGGTTTGVWSTNGSGTFSPASNQLDAVYVPSAADRLMDFVVLTLSSTSKDDCSIATSTMKIIYSKFPGSNAGLDQEVCTQIGTAALKGKVYTNGNPVWSTSGTGTFSPSANVLNPTYMGSADDIKSGAVTITLFETSADSCYIHSSTMKISFIPPPTVNAGGTKYVLAGNAVTLTPSVSDSNVHYLWSPNINIDNDTLKNPVITGDINRSYTLTVTDSRGCTTQDEIAIKVSPTIKVPNVFTPNGDGINDNWEIQGLVAYANATVDVFDRAGQSIYHSIGYNKTWDGTINGKTLPSGTYYYVINTKHNDVVLSGPVTIIR
jgi:gliding motility-associated-like protein